MEKNNKVMMIIIIALLVILLVSVAVVSVFAVRMLSGSGEDQTETPEVTATVLGPNDLHLFSLTDPITTNLRIGEDGRNHNFRTGVTIGINATEDSDEYNELITLIYETEPIIRSTALSVIMTKTYEELRYSNGLVLLSDEILRALQETYGTHLIAQVMLTEFNFG